MERQHEAIQRVEAEWRRRVADTKQAATAREEALKKTLATVRDDLRRANEEVQRTAARLSDAHRKNNSDMSSQALALTQRHDEEIDSLATALAESKAQLSNDHVRWLARESWCQCAVAEWVFCELQAALVSTRTDLEQQLSITRQLEGDVQALTRQNRLLEDALAQMKAEAEARLSQQDGDIASLQQQLEASRAQIDALEASRSEVLQANQELRSANSKLQADMQAAAAKDLAQGSYSMRAC